MEFTNQESFSQEPLSMDIRRYLGLFKHWWWLIVIGALIGGLSSYIFSSRQPNIYQAGATILISRPQVTTDYASSLANERIAKTYSNLIIQQPTLKGVIEQLGLDLGVNQLQKAISVSVVPDTQLLELKIEDTDPTRASQIANTIGTVFAETNAELQASRYEEMKKNLEAQMSSMDEQIDSTNQALEEITGGSVNPQEDMLQTKLAIYRDIYQSLLRKSIETEALETDSISAEALSGTSPDIEERLEIIKQEIDVISDEMDNVSFYDPAYDLLQLKLDAYQNLYKTLVQDLALEDISVKAQNAQLDELNDELNTESLSAQLEAISSRIQDTTAELEAIGASPETGSQRDRLESNLVLYQQTYANLVQSYESVRLAEVQNTTSVDLVQPATPPQKPIRPDIPSNTLLGAVVGFMGAVGIVFLIEVLDDTVRGPEEISRHLQLPVLGVIYEVDKDDELITITHPRSPISEAFRALRTNIQYSSVDFPLSKILITSPQPKDGKTTVATNLSVVMAQGGKKVSLVDADLRRPRVHKKMQVSNRQGLTSLFAGDNFQFDGVMKAANVSGLYLLTSGNLPPNPAELMSSERMYKILNELDARSDVVILDSPPAVAVTDPVILSKHVDGVLLVVEPGKTKLAAAQKVVEEMRRVGANLIGVVLNNVGANGSHYYSYYYSYYTDEYYGGRKTKRKEKNGQ